MPSAQRYAVALLNRVLKGSRCKDAFLVRAQSMGLELNGCDSSKVHELRDSYEQRCQLDVAEGGQGELPDNVYVSS